MTRVTGTHNENELLSFALKTTTARVEERCRELKCGSVDSLGGAQRAFANRSLRVNRNTSDDYLVTIHVDQSALANGIGRSSLPIESVKRLCCDGHAVILGEDENGEPLNISRKTRTVPTAIKRALMARDKSCSFPGCHHTRFVDAHHIQHWSAGGETSLNNLMLLCSRHHTLVHEGGFTLQRDYQNQWFFKRPDGRAVPAYGYHARDIMDDDIEEVSRRAGPRSERFNNPPAGGVIDHCG